MALRVSRLASHPLAIVLAITAILYGVGLAIMPPEGLTHHDTGGKYLQVRNLRLTPFGLDYSINYPARQLDPQLQFVPFREKLYFIAPYGGQDRIYLQWPIFLGLLTRIPWKLFGFWGLYIVPFLAGLGGCWATYRLALALDIPRRVAWVAAPLVGLATPLSLYALLFFENTLAAMLVALSLLFAVRSTQVLTHDPPLQSSSSRLVRSFRHLPAAAWCGAFLAASVYFRSELYVLAAVMGLVYLLLALRFHTWRRRFLWWLGAFLLALVPLWLFYVVTEGNLLPLHATWYFAGASPVAGGTSGGFELPALRYIVSAGWGIVPDFLLGPQTFPSSPVFPLWVGILGVGGTVACAVAALCRAFARKWVTLGQSWQAALFVLGLVCVCISSLFIAFMPQPYHNLHGFLVAGPFIALALWPPSKLLTADGISKHGILYVLTLLWVAAHTIIISALSGLGPISRAEWGQRYLLSAYPALIVLGVLGALGLSRELFTRAGAQDTAMAPRLRALFASFAILLAATGLLFSLRGYVALYDERTQVRDWLTLANTMPAQEPLVTDEWWLPLNLAADFYSRPIMLAEGDDELTRWAAQMRTRGVSTFGFMTDKPAIFTSTWITSTSGLQALGQPQEVRGMWLQRYELGK
jgi:hypothetical protein